MRRTLKNVPGGTAKLGLSRKKTLNAVTMDGEDDDAAGEAGKAVDDVTGGAGVPASSTETAAAPRPSSRWGVARSFVREMALERASQRDLSPRASFADAALRAVGRARTSRHRQSQMREIRFPCT